MDVGSSGCSPKKYLPPPGNLPRDRTEGQTPFQVIGVAFVGPLRYRKKLKTEGKAYILLYACSLTSAVYVDLGCTPFSQSKSGFCDRKFYFLFL